MRTVKGLGSFLSTNVSACGFTAAALLASTAAVPAYAQSTGIVVNPGFETGDFSGWTTQGGTVGSTSFPIDENWFTGPSTFATIRSAGEVDAITGIPAVFAGNYSARINDSHNDNSATALRQTITGYNANKLYYAWNAVLQPSHGENDSPAFLIKVTDKTTNTVITNITYSAYTAQNATSFFRDTGTGWVTSDWKVEDIDTTAGHDYEMLFVGVDCPYGGHAGYVYVDAFGGVVPTPNEGIDFDPNTDVVRGASFLIGGNKNIDDAVNDALSGLNAGTLNPVFDGGILHIDQVPGGPLTVAFSVTDLGGVVDTNGNDVEFAGGITGTGILTKIGNGTWMLSGINLVNGGVVVNQGGLNVAGTLSTLVLNVNAGGTLGGRGSIIAAVNINSGGVISPGNSPGTLTIIGSPLVMNAGSLYRAEIDGRVYSAAGGAGSYDRVALTTGATFTAGGTVTPILRGITGAANNTFTPVLGDKFRIVDGGVVSGAFAAVTQPSTGLAANTRFDVLYNPTSIDLVVTPGSFATLGTTAGWRTNAIAAGAGLDAVRPAAGSRAGTLQALFNGLYGYDAAAYGASLEQLSGEIHAEAMTVARDAAADTTKLALSAASTMVGREDCVEGPESETKCLEPTHRPALWTQLYYEKSRYKSDARAARFANEQRGFAVGVHLINAPETRVGVGARYSDNELENTIGSRADANGFTLFGYASHDFGPLTVSGTAGWGTTDVHSTRTQALTTGVSTATARYEVHTVNAALEARYNLQLGNAVIRPLAGLSYERLKVKTGQELNPSAPAAALTLPRVTRSTTRTKLGAEAAIGLGAISLVANGAWQHVIDGSTTLVRPVTLGPASWQVSSVGLKKDSYEFGAGVQAALGARTSLRLEYAGVRDGRSYRSDQGFLRLAHAF
jgi:uncharacterized protein with beta-barrel porin domain